MKKFNDWFFESWLWAIIALCIAYLDPGFMLD